MAPGVQLTLDEEASDVHNTRIFYQNCKISVDDPWVPFWMRVSVGKPVPCLNKCIEILACGFVVGCTPVRGGLTRRCWFIKNFIEDLCITVVYTESNTWFCMLRMGVISANVQVLFHGRGRSII